MPVSNLMHSADQQNSGTDINAVLTAQNNPTSDLEKRKLIQQQLVLLLHAHRCQRFENQSNGEVRECTLPHCRIMKDVLSHMTNCSAGNLCPVVHCSSSRRIISHWKNCALPDCPVCIPLKQASDRQQLAANDDASQCSSQNLNASTQTAQNSQLQVSTRPLLQNSTTGAIGNQLAHNLQPEVKTENVTLISAPPTMTETLPPYNPTVVKEWHQSVTQDLRHHLVQKIVQVIFRATNITSLQDSGMINLVAYAQRVEEETFNVADSRDEYYQLLAEQIYRVQKEQQQAGSSNLTPMLGNSTVEASSEHAVTRSMSDLHLSSLTVPVSQQQLSPPNNFNCINEEGHQHEMEELNFGLDGDSATGYQKQTISQESRLLSIQTCVEHLVHACQCRDANCRLPRCQKMKRVVQHANSCKQKTDGGCPICKQLIALCYYHAEHCQEAKCPVSFCINIKNKLKQQQLERRLEQAWILKRRIAAMQNHGMSSAELQPSPGYSSSSSQPSDYSFTAL